MFANNDLHRVQQLLSMNDKPHDHDDLVRYLETIKAARISLIVTALIFIISTIKLW